MTVWLNGKIMERDEAKVSVFDAAFQHGVGLFETMHARREAVFRLHDHLQRLADSARQLRLSDRLRIGPLSEAVLQAVRTHTESMSDKSDPLRVRLTITGGDLNLLMKERRASSDPTIMIQVQPATRYPRELVENGAAVVVADVRDNPFNPCAGHKTVNYWPRLLSLQNAAAKRADEALHLTITNHLSAGAVSNAFIVKDGTLLTPIARGEEEKGSLPSPALPGITRKVIKEIAAGLGIGCGQKMITISEVLDADEMFLTNSSWGVLPVVRVEAKAIGDGFVGPVTRNLREHYWQLVDEETSNRTADDAEDQ
ncbi:MAG TPA: hypothetical protein ENJ06_05200 [Phycisphaeraceae bacterium]|nr:hypothetical protein [Phycisphaeraceae bacterium]